MAFYPLYNHSSSSSIRFYKVGLFALVLICSISYCSSSPTYLFGASSDNSGDNDYDIDRNSYGQNYRHRRFGYQPLSSIQDIDIAEQRFAPKNRVANLLSKAALLQDDRPHRQYLTHANNRRYVPQAFHAMRG
ncbi:unnamed protein product [Adineta steineri]|uniref:Uncharacterized protein n=1 Tax=Adineta steineri TaxID=433720 RepID=A0A815S0J2_9BILA|nr:unnamed protein product [Adineta steineri]CAF0738470.1 unnamed protein product [Adineta steineri]CAF0748273.1 unnamed protein product [Adineta steineri]CAF1484414.1 unnamed protein product [Adineta steineri]CAF1639485.1 unnamed protein product [Adineta steineri]